jgi:hypothetical protein
VSLVNPYHHLRKELKGNNQDNVMEILLLSGRDLRKEYHVKDFEQGSPTHIINTDQEVDDSWIKLKNIL